MIFKKEADPMDVRDAIFCDMEGPISGQDHAAEVCRRFIRGGDRFFAVLSRYDDILTLIGKEGYEPGDTLQLLIPFLVEAGVTDEDLRLVSAEAGLVPGIRKLFTGLQRQGCSVWIISTSYREHASSIAQRVGVSLDRVYCTDFSMGPRFASLISAENLGPCLQEIREIAVELYHDDLGFGRKDREIQELLDPFFNEVLPGTEFGQIMAQIKVMGGRRKVRALEGTIRNLSDAFVVVDSITDFRMAQAVEAAGGIALAWNGNKYIIPYATCGVAAVNAEAIMPLFQAWRQGGRKAVREIVESMPIPRNPKRGPYYHWLAGRDSKFHQEVLTIHQRLRIVCRGRETARLG
jgi:energy-converting hydrogenase A subunit R